MKGNIAVIFLCSILFYACKTTSKNSIDKLIAAQHAIMPADSMIAKQKKGIDLFATGNEPVSWSLEMDFDKSIVFSAADGMKFYVLPAFEKKEVAGGTETFQIHTDPGPVTIKISDGACSINGIGQYNKKATISIKDKLYSGCGQYLYDHRLNDIWVLDMINNTQQSAKDFSKGLPLIQFDLQQNKMTGSDGCNSISSVIEVQGNRIKFGALVSTRMACSNDNVGKIFSEKISDKLVDYYEENGRLILYLIDDSKLIFKRKEL